jgi:hypothetical protein
MFNRYVYANANPFRYLDPDGRQGKGWREKLSDAIASVLGSNDENSDNRQAAEQLGAAAASEVPGQSTFKAMAANLKDGATDAASDAAQVATTIAVCTIAAAVGLDAESVAMNGAKEGTIRTLDHVVETNGAKELGESGLGAIPKLVPWVKLAAAGDDLNTFFTCAGQRTTEYARQETNHR